MIVYAVIIIILIIILNKYNTFSPFIASEKFKKYSNSLVR